MNAFAFYLLCLVIRASAEVPIGDATLPVVNVHYDFQAQDSSARSKTDRDMANWEAKAERLAFAIDRSAQELNDFVNLENSVLEDASQVLKSPLLRGSATQ